MCQDINIEVQLFNLDTLMNAFGLANLVEGKCNSQQGTN